MPQSMTLLCPTNLTMSMIIEACKKACPDLIWTDGKEVQLNSPDNRHATVSRISNEEDCAAEYEDNEDLDIEFRSAVWDRSYFWIRFNNFELAKLALISILNSQEDAKKCWLDTDYGWVIRGDKILSSVRDDANWDWRHPQTT